MPVRTRAGLISSDQSLRALVCLFVYCIEGGRNWYRHPAIGRLILLWWTLT